MGRVEVARGKGADDTSTALDGAADQKAAVGLPTDDALVTGRARA